MVMKPKEKKTNAPRAPKPVKYSLLEAAAAKPGLARAAGDPVLIGDTSPRVAWDSGQVTVGDTPQRIVILDGLYGALASACPSRGTTLTEWPDLTVDGAVLSPKKGGLGRLTITLVSSASYSGSSVSHVLRSKIEIDSSQTDKPITCHPILAGYADAADHIEMWKESPRSLKHAYQYKDADGNVQDLVGKEKEFAQKIMRGVESYALFSPVVIQTTVYDGRPETSMPGFVDTPPAEVGTYVYLKTGDRVVQNDDKTWTRTETWTGADEIDEDLYSPGVTSP